MVRSDRDPENGVYERLAVLETQVDELLALRRVNALSEPKTFLGIAEDKMMRGLVILALAMAAGGDLPTVLSNLAKVVQP